MQLLSLVWGILAILGMIVGFFPCLGAFNWLNIPFSGLGIIVSAIAWATAGSKPKRGSIVGLILCIVACIFGIMRLGAGGGVV